VDESLILLTPEEACACGVRTKGKAGGVGSEAEEAEPAESSLEARLEKAMAEPDYEREETFRYLKEFKKRKRLGLEHTFECQEEAREKARAAVERMLDGDAEKSARESERTMNEEAMVESAGVGIAYVKDENGKLVKRRASAKRRTSARSRTPTDVIRIHDVDYVQDETGELVPYVPPPPQQFARKDRARASKNRDRRHGRRWYAKRLLAIAEGNVTVSKEQCQALLAFGRLKGWHRRSR